jgi:hypothetical protein
MNYYHVILVVILIGVTFIISDENCGLCFLRGLMQKYVESVGC